MATSPFQFPTNSVEQSCDRKSNVLRSSSINTYSRTICKQIYISFIRRYWYLQLFPTYGCRRFTSQSLQYKFKLDFIISPHQRQPSRHPCSAEIRRSWGSAGGWAELWRTPSSSQDECGAWRVAHHHPPNPPPEGANTGRKRSLLYKSYIFCPSSNILWSSKVQMLCHMHGYSVDNGNLKSQAPPTMQHKYIRHKTNTVASRTIGTARPIALFLPQVRWYDNDIDHGPSA